MQQGLSGLPRIGVNGWPGFPQCKKAEPEVSWLGKSRAIQKGNHMIERRKFYRKLLKSNGHIKISDQVLTFVLQDISIAGLRGHFDSDPSLKVDQFVPLSLPDMGISGSAGVVWFGPDPQGGWRVGFDMTRVDGQGRSSYLCRDDGLEGKPDSPQ